MKELYCKRCKTMIPLPDANITEIFKKTVDIARNESKIEAIKYLKNNTKIDLKKSKIIVSHISPELNTCVRCNHLLPAEDVVICENCNSVNLNLKVPQTTSENNPIQSWQKLQKIKDSLVETYGENSKAIIDIINNYEVITFKEWVFPIVSMGNIILSRFANYEDMIKGPYVSIEYNKKYIVNYFNTSNVKHKYHFYDTLNMINWHEIEEWIDHK